MSASRSSIAAGGRDGIARCAVRRVVDFVLLPPGPAESPATPPRVPARVARRAAVLGARADVPAVAAALAGTLASGGAPLVACWAPEPPAPPPDVEARPAADPPALPAARRLAAALTAAGTPAAGRGRLAWASLPPAPDQAASAWTVAADRAGPGAATVLAVAGPRPEALDAVLTGLDLVVLVVPDGDATLAALARERVGNAGAAVVVAPPLTGMARLLALAGVGRLRSALAATVARPAAEGLASRAQERA